MAVSCPASSRSSAARSAACSFSISRARASASLNRPPNSACASGERRISASARNWVSSVSCSFPIRSVVRAIRRVISSSSRRMSRSASSIALMAWGPLSVMAWPSPPGYRAVEHGHGIFGIEEAVLFDAQYVVLDDAVIEPVDADGLIGDIGHALRPDRDVLDLAGFLVFDRQGKYPTVEPDRLHDDVVIGGVRIGFREP